MSPPPDGVNAQSRWPCGTATRTYSLYIVYVWRVWGWWLDSLVGRAVQGCWVVRVVAPSLGTDFFGCGAGSRRI